MATSTSSEGCPVQPQDTSLTVTEVDFPISGRCTSEELSEIVNVSRPALVPWTTCLLVTRKGPVLSSRPLVIDDKASSYVRICLNPSSGKQQLFS